MRLEESSIGTGASMLSVALALIGCGHAASAPSSIPIDPITNDAVYVVNGGDSSISVIDAITDEVVASIELFRAR